METAVREIQEEAGLTDLRYVASLGRTQFRFRRQSGPRQKGLIEKRVQFFLFEAAADAKEHLTGEEAIWEAVWVPADKVFETSGYRNLDRLLAKALRIIAQHRGAAPARTV